MAGGDSGGASAVAFDETGVFEEPGGGEFCGVASRSGPVGDFVGGQIGGSGDGGQLRGGDDGVLEVGAGAAGVGVAGGDEHSLAAADVTDGGGDFEQCGWCGRAGEALLEIGVFEIGLAVWVQLEIDAGDDVAVRLVGVESAGTIAEVAGGFVEGDVGLGFAVEGVDGDDSFGDFLTVGTDVLDGRAADGAGDAGHALYAGEALLNGVLHEVVPGFAGADGEEILAEVVDSADFDLEDEAGKARIGYEEIAAAAEDEQRERVILRPSDGLRDVYRAVGFREETGRAADFEGGEGGQIDVFADFKGRR